MKGKSKFTVNLEEGEEGGREGRCWSVGGRVGGVVGRCWLLLVVEWVVWCVRVVCAQWCGVACGVVCTVCVVFWRILAWRPKKARKAQKVRRCGCVWVGVGVWVGGWVGVWVKWWVVVCGSLLVVVVGGG